MNTQTQQSQPAYQVQYPTLAELQAMSAQDIFNRAAGHLLKQGKRALAGGAGSMCLYRGPEGTACAVGALIPQELYSSHLEGEDAWSMIESASSVAPTTLREALRPHLDLLTQIQAVHDSAYDVGFWPAKLAEVADEFDLQMVPLEGLAVIPMGQ